jgi:hypothetical protein
MYINNIYNLDTELCDDWGFYVDIEKITTILPNNSEIITEKYKIKNLKKKDKYDNFNEIYKTIYDTYEYYYKIIIRIIYNYHDNI